MTPAFVTLLFDGRNSGLPRFCHDANYSPEWVHKLYRGVKRNMGGEPFRFVCLVDQGYRFDEPAIEAVPLMDPVGSWMSVLEMFRPDLGIERGIAMGLDTIICGSLADLVAYDGPFALPSDPFKPHEVCNGVMLWDAATAEELWATWDGDRVGWSARCQMFGVPSEMLFLRHVIGDRCDRIDTLVPGQVVSWKVHCKCGENRQVIDRARVVYFHGNPKANQLPSSEPLLGHWR